MITASYNQDPNSKIHLSEVPLLRAKIGAVEKNRSKSFLRY